MSDRYLTPAIKQIMFDRAHRCCECCLSQAAYSPQPFSIEHIVPISKGGSNDLDNLALAYQGCNNFKYIKTQGLDPISLLEVNLFHPKLHQWREHFIWDANYLHIYGITPAGRATVNTLKLNRAELVNLRKVLFAIGEHPPQFAQ
jgi:hypothetical protein